MQPNTTGQSGDCLDDYMTRFAEDLDRERMARYAISVPSSDVPVSYYYMKLPGISRIQWDWNVYPYPETCAAYILWQDETPIYVGETVDLSKRLFGHSDKTWDYLTWLPAESKAHARWLEAVLIERLEPTLNKRTGYRVNDDQYSDHWLILPVAVPADIAWKLDALASKKGVVAPELVRQAIRREVGTSDVSPQFIPRAQAAKMLGVHVKTVSRWQQEGQISPRDVREINGRYYIRYSAIESMSSNHKE